MQTASISPTQFEAKDQAKTDQFVFVLQLHDGRYVIGSAANPCKRIASINSGHSRAIPKSLQVNRVVGIKPVNEQRNLISVVKAFADQHGDGKILAV